MNSSSFFQSFAFTYQNCLIEIKGNQWLFNYLTWASYKLKCKTQSTHLCCYLQIVKRQTSSYSSTAVLLRHRFRVRPGVTHILSWHLPHYLQHGERYSEKCKRQIRLRESDIGRQGRLSTLQSWGKSTHMESYYSLTHTVCECTVSCGFQQIGHV